MRFLSVTTAAVSLLMLGTAAAQVGGVAGGIGTGSSLGGAGSASLFGTGSRPAIGSAGIPMGATELGTGGLSPPPAATGIPGTAPVTPMPTPGIAGSVPGLAGAPFGSVITGYGPGGMQPLPGSPGAGGFGGR